MAKVLSGRMARTTSTVYPIFIQEACIGAKRISMGWSGTWNESPGW